MSITRHTNMKLLVSPKPQKLSWATTNFSKTISVTQAKAAKLLQDAARLGVNTRHWNLKYGWWPMRYESKIIFRPLIAPQEFSTKPYIIMNDLTSVEVFHSSNGNINSVFGFNFKRKCIQSFQFCWILEVLAMAAIWFPGFNHSLPRLLKQLFISLV